MGRRRIPDWALGIILGVLAFTAAYCAWTRPMYLERIERSLLDWHLASLRLPRDDLRIVLVEARERSFGELGMWPWPRAYHGELLRQIRSAKCIAVDILFHEESVASSDQVLVDAVRERGNVVLASHLDLDETGRGVKLFKPFKALAGVALGTGVANVMVDIDYAYRFFHPYWMVNAGTSLLPIKVPALPSLALATWSIARNPYEVVGMLPEIESFAEEDFFRVGSRVLQTDSGRLWVIPERISPVSYEYVDVFKGWVPPAAFRDAIVIVGVAASGVRDNLTVPWRHGHGAVSGPEFLANAIYTLDAGICPVRVSALSEALLALSFTLLGGLFAVRFRPKVSIFPLVGALLLLLLGEHYLFRKALLWVAFVTPAGGAIVAFTASAVMRMRRLQRQFETTRLSSDAIRSLARLDPGKITEYEPFLQSLVAGVAKETHVVLLESTLSVETARVFLATHGGAQDLPDDVVLVRTTEAHLPWRLIVRLGSRSKEGWCVMLGWQQEPLPDVVSSVAVLVVASSWFFESIMEARTQRRMLYGAIRAMVEAVDAKDPSTSGHSRRVADLAVRIAENMGCEDRFLEDLQLGADIHDVGKIGIPDNVLRKEAKLTDEEYVLMQQHPSTGERIMRPVALPDAVMSAMFEHHERWNGAGYPQGLCGEEISLAGRIVAVADVYDALRSERFYKKGWSAEETRNFITERAGVEFDPLVVEAFLRISVESLPPGGTLAEAGKDNGVKAEETRG